MYEGSSERPRPELVTRTRRFVGLGHLGDLRSFNRAGSTSQRNDPDGSTRISLIEVDDGPSVGGATQVGPTRGLPPGEIGRQVPAPMRSCERSSAANRSTPTSNSWTPGRGRLSLGTGRRSVSVCGPA